MQHRISALLRAWHHTAGDAGSSLVLPDGCLDLIGQQSPGQAPHWKLSALFDRACLVEAPAGQRYVGYRLQPGAQVSAAALLRTLEGIELDDTAGVLERLDAAVALDARLTEALQALATEGDVRRARRQLGVGERALQRLLSDGTGRPPVYWKRLARLRRAARDLTPARRLSEVAVDHGFADQAHMNLEFRRWLGLTPARVQADAPVRRLLAEPGYA